jgi:cathepsin B
MQCPGAESVKYWLAASTWGSAWGDNGIFRIVRGNDESGIESNIIWGSVFFPF